MALQRFWLAIVVLLGLQMTAAAPSIARYATPHHGLANTLKPGQIMTLLEDFVLSYQRQTHTVSIDREQLEQPHRLAIASLGPIEGKIFINGQEIQTLERGSTVINLTPHLQNGSATVLMTGRYTVTNEPVAIRFTSPDTELDHQPAEAGYLNYQLNLQVK